jgi:hypothetical protein
MLSKLRRRWVATYVLTSLGRRWCLHDTRTNTRITDSVWSYWDVKKHAQALNRLDQERRDLARRARGIRR